MKKVYILIAGWSFFLFSGCATYKAKYSDGRMSTIVSNKLIDKTFYLIGDAGDANTVDGSLALNAFKSFIEARNTREDYLLYLGDNIYEKGLSDLKDSRVGSPVDRIQAQINIAKSFGGKTIFIPGNHDWYSGLPALKDQEAYIEKALGKNTFKPEKSCPIETMDITDNIVLLTIDTQWYLANWDQYPTINDNCQIKTRKDFFIELEGELKKNNEKTILLAMHHPAYTYGPHGGGFSMGKYLLFPFQSKIPLPGIATLAAQLRAQGGISPQDRFNSRYSELMNRLITLAKGNDRLILASGHEHSMQYIDADGVKQIVSGSGSKTSAVLLGEGAKFVSGNQGFAQLQVYKDGSSQVNYYTAEDGKASLVFSSEVHSAYTQYDTSKLATTFETSKNASAYQKEAIEKGNSYKWFWGEHYRYAYGTDINVPVATLDTLFGGLTVERKGGGHQTRSLRLKDRDGRNFSLRGVKKSATQYLQSVLFTDTYVEKEFEETATEDIILDFYTASHPYASLTIGRMANAVGVYHTNPSLLYIPKHKALGKYNEEFGDELYVIEERPDNDFLDIPSFGKPDEIESTADLMKNLRKDEKYQMDEGAFIKARLFDMLLGDWDRHQDQWRWSRFDISDDKKVYRPIPRDRDQVFSFYDGALLDVVRVLVPSAKQLQKFDRELKDIKWLNAAGIKLDRTFAQQATREEWLRQGAFLKENLTDAVIDEAFLKLPGELRDATSEEIKKKLKSRRDDMVEVAGRYYDYLSRLVIITGTDKDDHFEITRGNGFTKISISRIKNGGKQAPFKERVVKSDETREIWIYGLDDDDQFVVNGKGSNPIFMRIIGGQNNDSYTIENGRAIKVHDHKSKPNTIVKKGGAAFRFADSYNVNTYNSAKLISRQNAILPSIGANPDDGVKIGVEDTYLIKGFKTNPFDRKHVVRANYYFATEGFDLEYTGEFANIFGKWNLLLNGHFTSENFTRNFFGFGNDTENNEEDEELELNFNRVKTAIRSGRIGFVKNGEYGSRLVVSAGVENVEVENTLDRFIGDFFAAMPEIFDSKTFANVDVDYRFASFDNKSNPARGTVFKLKGGVRSNVDDTERTYGYVHPALSFYNAITKDGKLVLKTMAQGQFNFGDAYEFYQAAVIGANNGLRGYRTERFSGDSALALGADLRFSFPQFKTGLLPLQLGIFAGYDIGRVWFVGDDSNLWHDDVGGGLWINAVDTLSGQLGVFSGDDGLRIAFGFGVSL